METIRGRRSLDLDLNGFTDRLANHRRIILDLGTGDGRYVHYLAATCPTAFIIGLDSCRENLREYSRAQWPNMLFVIAMAQELPGELNGLVSHIAINFPWGSLLESLLNGDSKLLGGLASIAQTHTGIDIRLNGGALTEAGTDLESGSKLIHTNLSQAGWQIKKPNPMNACVLQNFPSTWARRLAQGRDPRALAMSGYLAK